MEQNETEKQELMTKIESVGQNDQNRGLTIWHLAGGLAIAGLAVLFVMNAPDIKRYIRISTM